MMIIKREWYILEIAWRYKILQRELYLNTFIYTFYTNVLFKYICVLTFNKIVVICI